MGYYKTRKLPTAPAPRHTCALPVPVFMTVEVKRVTTPDAVTIVKELVPFGDWRPETVYHDRLRAKSRGEMGALGCNYTLENGRVYERETYRSNRDR